MPSVKRFLKDAAPDGLKQARQQLLYRYRATMDPSRYPDELRRMYRRALGRELDLEHPMTFNEKINWMKLYNATPEKGRLADKYLVREFVRERIGEEHLVPLLGAWDDPADIDFDKLPDRFVLKATHGCGWNIIVRHKAKLDIAAARRKLAEWLSIDFAFVAGFELQYHHCEPRIIAEAFLENRAAGGTSDLYDYKFWCFDGTCRCVQFLEGRASGLHMAFYNRSWEREPFVYDYPRIERDVPKPENLDEMIALAERLATGFPHVRVDFYRLDDGSIYFGELTFTSASGFCGWDPLAADAELGVLIALPEPMTFEK